MDQLTVLQGLMAMTCSGKAQVFPDLADGWPSPWASGGGETIGEVAGTKRAAVEAEGRVLVGGQGHGLM